MGSTIYQQPTRLASEVAATSNTWLVMWDQSSAGRKNHKINLDELKTLLGVTSGVADGAVTTAKLAASAVTYAKIQNVSATDKLLGRSTAGAGVVEEITCTAFGRNLIDDADATAGRTTLGLGSLATLSAVGTAQITDGSVTFVKTTGVAAATHTHAIADVTNLQTTLDGKAATTHTHAAADITSGTIATARLGSGTANSTTFLRGDNTWQTVSGGGTPGGSDTQIQFNSAGAFGGSTDLTFGAGALRVNGFIHAGASGSSFRMSSAGNGVGVLTNDAGNDLSRICLGGTTSSFPAIKRSGTAIHARLGDDSAGAEVQASVFTATNQIAVNGTSTTTQLAHNGAVLLQLWSGGQVDISSAAHLGWGSSGVSSPDLIIRRDAANILAQRNSTNGNTFKVYRTFASSSTFERGTFGWHDSSSDTGTVGNTLRIGTEKGSVGGTARDLALITNGTTRVTIDATTGVPTIAADQIRVTTAKTPSSATDTGVAGSICWDANYLYVCTATNTWRRVAHATW